MRPLYLFLVLLAGLLANTPAAQAQDDTAVARPAAPAALPAPAAALPDTAAALHRLFAAKRSSRNKVLAATLLGSGAVIGLTVAANSGPGSEAYTAIGAIVVGIVLVPTALVVELVAYNNNYSRRQERLTIADWQAHLLAPYMRRQLEPRYLAPDAPPRP